MGMPLYLERFDDASAHLLAELKRADADGDQPIAQGEVSAADDINDPALILAAETASLRQTLDDLQSDIRAFKEKCIAAVTAEYANAAAAVLPTIAEHGFAAEISQATLRIALLSRIASASLSVNPVHHDRLVELLACIEPETTLEIRGDETYSTSDASLTWDGGGAEFDLGALTETALRVLERQLENTVKRIGKNDH